MFSSNTTQTSGGYQISRSLRFNSADSAYLNRTPASAGNRKTWTWSAWVKKALVADNNPMLFTAGSGSPYDQLYFDTNDKLTWYTNGVAIFLTNAVYRDPSAWYHIVLAVDTTQASGSNRVKLYVNSVQQTFSSSTDVGLNQDTATNNTVAHNIGRLPSALYYLNGYMTEVNFIDGQQLTPSSFGETNAQTGVWQPKAYSGSYGTNGFYLNFSDNSNTTAATLGKDYSGNGNNWTPNNFSVTAGAGNDSLVDSPTSYGTDTGVGGEVRGNYATMNPLQKGSTVTLTNGNLDSAVGASDGKALATIGMSSGKWYAEASNFTGLPTVGIATGASSLSSFTGGDVYSWGYYPSGTKYTNGSSSAYGASWTTTDTIGIAFDADAGTLTFYKNGTSQGTAFSSLTSGPYFFSNGNSANTLCSWNFGQRPFAYTAPSGYKALCTQNLPTPTIGATTATLAGKYFNPVLWTGNGSTQTISGVGFQPDFTWIKCRSNAATAHILQDVIRGAGPTLFSNDTSAQLGNSGDLITSWNSDGFGVNRNFLGGTTNNSTNGSGYTYVAWNWKGNGSGVTNTAGSITSTVSANTTSGFSVVTFTSPASGAFTVGHGLGVAPAFVVTKLRDAANNWNSYHVSLGNSASINLNRTDAVATGSTNWNSTSPTSTVFSFGSGFAGSYPIVIYCFAPVAGYSAFGSFVGNGSTDGPFVYTGFRPKYIMFKASSIDQAWGVEDTTRSPYNLVNLNISPNYDSAENSGYAKMDILSNGFKIRETDTFINSNGATYIFMAFAENPFKYSLAR